MWLWFRSDEKSIKRRKKIFTKKRKLFNMMIPNFLYSNNYFFLTLLSSFFWYYYYFFFAARFFLIRCQSYRANYFSRTIQKNKEPSYSTFFFFLFFHKFKTHFHPWLKKFVFSYIIYCPNYIRIGNVQQIFSFFSSYFK